MGKGVEKEELKEEIHFLKRLIQEDERRRIVLDLSEKYELLKGKFEDLKEEVHQKEREIRKMRNIHDQVDPSKWRDIPRREVIQKMKQVLRDTHLRYSFDPERGVFLIPYNGREYCIFIPEEGDLDYGIAMNEAVMNLKNIVGPGSFSVVEFFMLVHEKDLEKE